MDRGDHGLPGITGMGYSHSCNGDDLICSEVTQVVTLGSATFVDVAIPVQCALNIRTYHVGNSLTLELGTHV